MAKSKHEFKTSDVGDSPRVDQPASDIDSDKIQCNFKAARNILNEYFKFASLGDGPSSLASKSKGLEARRRAERWIDFIEDCVTHVSNDNIRYLLSMATQFLVEEVTLAAPSSKAVEDSNQEYHLLQKKLQYVSLNASRAKKHSNRDAILDMKIRAVVGKKDPAKITSKQIIDVRKQVHKDLGVSDAKDDKDQIKEAWPSTSVVRKRAKKLGVD